MSLGTLIYVFLIYRKAENQCGSAGGWHLLEQSEQHLSASASPRPPGRGARLPFSTASLSPPVLWFLERVSLSSTRCPVSLAVPPLHPLVLVLKFPIFRCPPGLSPKPQAASLCLTTLGFAPANLFFLESGPVSRTPSHQLGSCFKPVESRASQRGPS